MRNATAKFLRHKVMDERGGTKRKYRQVKKMYTKLPWREKSKI